MPVTIPFITDAQQEEMFMRWAKVEGYEPFNQEDEERDNRFVTGYLTTEELRTIFDAGFEAALEHMRQEEVESKK